MRQIMIHRLMYGGFADYVPIGDIPLPPSPPSLSAASTNSSSASTLPYPNDSPDPIVHAEDAPSSPLSRSSSTASTISFFYVSPNDQRSSAAGEEAPDSPMSRSPSTASTLDPYERASASPSVLSGWDVDTVWYSPQSTPARQYNEEVDVHEEIAISYQVTSIQNRVADPMDYIDVDGDDDDDVVFVDAYQRPEDLSAAASEIVELRAMLLAAERRAEEAQRAIAISYEDDTSIQNVETVHSSDFIDVEGDADIVVDVDDDVEFVRSYQRPEDLSAAASEMVEMREMFLAAERRAEEAAEALELRAALAEGRLAEVQKELKERMERTRCPICFDDLLGKLTILLQCGHLCCQDCAYEIDDGKCCSCRQDFNYYNRVYFP